MTDPAAHTPPPVWGVKFESSQARFLFPAIHPQNERPWPWAPSISGSTFRSAF